MRAYILTEGQARRVPRTLLLSLCLLYLVPGFTTRGPWGSVDAGGFGIALTFAQSGLDQWLSPSAFGLRVADEAPLSYWLIASVIRLTEPWLSAHAAARLTTGLLITLGLLALWRALLLFARRPEILPSDPFGASATPGLIARSMADTGVLIVLACCGLIIRLHETTADAIQFTWTALLLLGFAETLGRPWRGGLIAGAALATTALGTGPMLALLFALAWLAAHALSAPLRALARQSLPASLAVVAIALLTWLALVISAGDAGRTAMAQWWAATWFPSGTFITPWSDRLRTLAWFVWPAWPLAGWTLWKWRALWREPALVVPILCTLAVIVYLALQARVNEQALIPLALPLALLATWGLPTMARGLTSLLDWLAVALFSLFLIFIWGYWLALQTGFPPRMAASAARVAPGFQQEYAVAAGLLGGLATFAWLGLIRWRIGRGPSALWRPVILSAGGLTITWLLLITLWLPFFDARTSLRAPALAVSALIRAAAPHPQGQHGVPQVSSVSECVHAVNLGAAERAAFAYFGRIRFAGEGETCRWTLRAHAGPPPYGVMAPAAGWKRIWQGGRSIDRGERFALEQHLQ